MGTLMSEEELRVERLTGSRLQMRVAQLEVDRARCELESLHAEELLSRSVEHLEERLEAEAVLREEAEDQIQDMVARGGELERERSQLLQRLFEMRQKARAQGQQLEELEQSLEGEEMSSEILKARNFALAQDNAELVSGAKQEWQSQSQASHVKSQSVTGRAQWMPREVKRTHVTAGRSELDQDNGGGMV